MGRVVLKMFNRAHLQQVVRRIRRRSGPTFMQHRWIKPIEVIATNFTHNPAENVIRPPAQHTELGIQKTHWTNPSGGKRYLVKYDSEIRPGLSNPIKTDSSSVGDFSTAVHEYIASAIGQAIGVRINKVTLGRDPYTKTIVSVHEEVPRTRTANTVLKERVDEFRDRFSLQSPDHSAAMNLPYEKQTPEQRALQRQLYSDLGGAVTEPFMDQFERHPDRVGARILGAFLGDSDRFNYNNTLIDDRGHQHAIDFAFSSVSDEDQSHAAKMMKLEFEQYIDDLHRQRNLEGLRVAKITLHRLSSLSNDFLEQLGRRLPVDARYGPHTDPAKLVATLIGRRDAARQLYDRTFNRPKRVA